jgi:crotonobetainyl-CoA:carnitine CoA-transferase CaiB-like acyl-CoA transferase
LSLTLMRAGVAAGVVQDLQAAFDHPQTQANAMLTEIHGHRLVANPIKLARTPARLSAAPPPFARDTDAVLAQAGYSATQVAALEQVGALVRNRRIAANDPNAT